MKKVVRFLFAGVVMSACVSAQANSALILNPGKAMRPSAYTLMSAGENVSQSTMPTGSTFAAVKAMASGENPDEYVIVDEDFSLFTAGTNDEPDTQYIGDSSNPMVDDNLTHQPGWSSNYATQAGGACALATPPIGGMINTPMGDYSGEITISFRFKALGAYANLGVLLGSGGIYNPQVVDMEVVSIGEEEVPGEGDLDEDGWKHVTITMMNTIGSNDCFVQFNSYYSMLLLDDIKVVAKVTDFIAPPTVLPATDFTENGFTAHWSAVRAADHYLFSLYYEKEVSDAQSLTYNFDNLPDTEGWTFDACDQVSNDQGYEGSKAAIITQNATITSPVYGGRVASTSIWMRNIGDAPYSAYVNLQGFDGSTWQDVGFIYIDAVADDAEGSRLVINADNRPNFYDKYSQIRYQFGGWDWDAEEGLAPQLVIDNITVDILPSVEKVYVITDEQTTETSRVLSDLNPDYFHFYQVVAVRGDMSAISSPMMALGLGTPVAAPATNITDNSYQANWSSTPRATSYIVRNFKVTQVEDVLSDALVFNETFANAAGGDRENPIMLENKWEYVSLDEYADNPGWVGGSTIITDGQVGTSGQGYSSLVTPPLSLDNGDGSFHISITVDVLYGPDAILVSPSTAQGDYIGFEAADGENTVDLYYTGGSEEETLTIRSQYGYPFYIKELSVYQDIMPGDVLYSFCGEAEVASDVTSVVFDNLDFETSPMYAYDVTAHYSKGLRECFSLHGERVFVSGNNSVNSALKDTNIAVHAVSGGVEINSNLASQVDIYNAGGILTATASLRGGSTFIPLQNGFYIVRISNKAYKVVVR